MTMIYSCITIWHQAAGWTMFVLLNILLYTIIITASVTYAFQYQKDTLDNCLEQVNSCTTSSTLWFQCPITCSEQYHLEGSMMEVDKNMNDPEDFFQLVVTKRDGSKLSLEDFEGYVTVYAILPIMIQSGGSGMAQFYYELLEHVHDIFPYTVEILALPFRVNGNDDDNDDKQAKNVELQLHEKPNVIVLEETKRPTMELDYIINVPIVAGNDQPGIFYDRVTIFLVSTDGMYLERLVSPNATLLERRISVFLKQLDFKPEL